jgi:hypothetical protein
MEELARALRLQPWRSIDPAARYLGKLFVDAAQSSFGMTVVSTAEFPPIVYMGSMTRDECEDTWAEASPEVLLGHRAIMGRLQNSFDNNRAALSVDESRPSGSVTVTLRSEVVGTGASNTVDFSVLCYQISDEAAGDVLYREFFRPFLKLVDARQYVNEMESTKGYENETQEGPLAQLQPTIAAARSAQLLTATATAADETEESDGDEVGRLRDKRIKTVDEVVGPVIAQVDEIVVGADGAEQCPSLTQNRPAKRARTRNVFH